jgi:ribonuclease E
MKKIIIDANFENKTRVVLLGKNDNIEDVEYEIDAKHQIKGNIYLAKITRIEPSLQAAFIDYGNGKSGFLPFGEIHPDYYNIPVSDQKNTIFKLKEISPPNITSDDLAEKVPQGRYDSMMDNEEIDINEIEKLVDDKVQPDFDLEVSDVDVETISGEKGDSNQYKNYKIQDVIKKGQIVLVQAIKEERGNKGASFSSYISLAGKYCVLMPTKPSQNGVSRKISNVEERKRLKAIVSNLANEGDKQAISIIARTAGIGRTTLEIKRDYDYLARLWNKIRESTVSSKAPSFIHEEEGIIQKTIRDMCDHTTKEIVVQGASAYQGALKFMKDILPTETSRLKEYKSKEPIFSKFAIEDKLSSLYQPVVSLPSGGYIVINPTEALISIDVNSGKATGERNIEETALKTNLEAAREVARQLRLRDLSGLIVIDFIDMYEAKNRKLVERSLKEFLSRDRARIQTSNISMFGLLEMSRQRLRPSFLESNSTICSHCNGKGIVRSDESNAMLILRTVENEIFDNNLDEVNIYACASSVVYLLNSKRQEIAHLEKKYQIKVNCYLDPLATSDSYSIEKVKAPKRIANNAPSKPAVANSLEEYLQSEAAPVVPAKGKQKWRISPAEKNSAVSKSPEGISEPVAEVTNNEELSNSDTDDSGITKTSSRKKVASKNPKRKRKKKPAESGDKAGDVAQTPGE